MDPNTQPNYQNQPVPQQYPAGIPQGQYPPSQAPQFGQMPGTVPQPHAVAPKSNPNSTQNTLLISEIRDGVVIMNDGSFRSVVMVKSINFDLMSPQEREGVEYAYQGFLNSLYFDIQITVHSSRVDLGPYLDKLDKIRAEHDNMLLALLMEDYIVFMDNLAQQTNIMDKKFYVVIPYFPTVDAQKAVQASKSFLGAHLARKSRLSLLMKASSKQPRLSFVTAFSSF